MAPKLIDIQFAEIIAWLKANGLEMHTDIKGSTYVCRKRIRERRAHVEPPF